MTPPDEIMEIMPELVGQFDDDADQDARDHHGEPEGNLVSPTVLPDPETKQRNRAKLQPRQLRAVDLLLAGHAVGDVAEELGLHRQRVSEWKRHPEFQAEIVARREELFAEMAGPLLESTRRATEVLAELMETHDSVGRRRAESVRLGAARAVLGLAARVLRP